MSKVSSLSSKSTWAAITFILAMILVVGSSQLSGFRNDRITALVSTGSYNLLWLFLWFQYVLFPLAVLASFLLILSRGKSAGVKVAGSNLFADAGIFFVLLGSSQVLAEAAVQGPGILANGALRPEVILVIIGIGWGLVFAMRIRSDWYYRGSHSGPANPTEGGSGSSSPHRRDGEA
jgi:hypothetical protein